MMDFISVPVTTAIVFMAFYKIIALFVRRREREMIIEKIESLQGQNLDLSKLNFSSNSGSWSIRLGGLFMGIGLGLLLACFLFLDNTLRIDSRSNGAELESLVIGSLSLLFGGLGLISAFIIEYKLNKKKIAEK